MQFCIIILYCFSSCRFRRGLRTRHDSWSSDRHTCKDTTLKSSLVLLKWPSMANALRRNTSRQLYEETSMKNFRSLFPPDSVESVPQERAFASRARRDFDAISSPFSIFPFYSRVCPCTCVRVCVCVCVRECTCPCFFFVLILIN